MIVEVQLLLTRWLSTKKTSAFGYKIRRARSWKNLCEDFEKYLWDFLERHRPAIHKRRDLIHFKKRLRPSRVATEEKADKQKGAAPASDDEKQALSPQRE